MRNFEERKAEVLRRSEQRIRHRKTMLLAACTVGCLSVICAGIVVLSQPPQTPITYTVQGSTDITEVFTTSQTTPIGETFRDGSITTHPDESVIATPQSVTVSNGEIACRYTDEQTVAAVNKALGTKLEFLLSSSETSRYYNENGSAPEGEESNPTVYTITLVDDSDNVTTYRLSGPFLYTDDTTYLLPAHALTALKTALHL